MYRQIQIHPDDWKYQCILWRPSPEESVHVYQLKTVTYGLASSPYQALRTLQQLALDEAQKYPQASKTLLRDVFVDDIVTGANSVEEAVQLKCELVDLLAQGGFELRKWSSNNSSVLEDMPVAHCETLRSFDQDTSPAVKVLGIHLCPITDEFMYHINVPHLSVTKRGILSTIARLFDPCGWVSPVIVWVKILLQTLWTLGLEWDQPVNAEVAQQWLHFRTSLSSLTNVRIPRYIHFLDACCIQFHGFCDASEKAYAAVIYVRLVDKTGMVSTHLVIAKSKVAPLKTLSIPRLELLGAMLLAKLWLYVNALFESRLDKFTMYMWSDSTTVLSWLKSSPHKFKAFVANRVSEIQAITPPGIWRYVPSVCNPADLASRGVYPDQLIESSLWFHGPDWLVDSDTEWPVNKFEVSPFLELPECKPVQSQALAVQEDRQNELVKLLETFSSFSKLKRVTAWILMSSHFIALKPIQH